MSKLQWGRGLLSGLYGFVRWLVLACLMVGTASSALAAKTYADNGDGTVTDPTTGLIWMRCSMGQTWTGSTCTGAAGRYTVDQAKALTGALNFAGHSDWRLPNIRELQTIVDRSVYNPAIDAVAFPNPPASLFWSASAYAFNSDYAWFVNFGYGIATYGDSAVSTYRVQPVRSGQSFGLLDIARPSTDYVDHGNGTVKHTPTGLTWQRCAVGQTWSGSTCSGSAGAYTWDAARLLTSSFAGQNDWRLPTQEELLSLVDYSRHSPAINASLFPNTPFSYFWSASAYAGISGSAWYVDFFNGEAYSSAGSAYRVRLVRSEQSFTPFALTVSKIGNGAVTSSPAGIDCGATCSTSFNSGTSVTLTATPAAGSTFSGWSGACVGTGSCIVSMSAAQSVAAAFSGIAPTFSLSPTFLSFAAQVVGATSAAKTVTLTNTGTAVLNIAGIVANGDFARTTTCGATLAPAANCAIDVTFTPSQAGANLSSLVITSNAASSPNTISLSGSGTTTLSAPVCSLNANPASIFAGGSSTLLASCSPAATSYVWTGGTCVGSATNSCAVTPTVTTTYSVRGTNAGGNGNTVSSAVNVMTLPPVFSGGLYDGIYQWAPGNYLTIQQHGTFMIATLYFTADGSYSFTSPDGHVLPVPQLDLFDLYSGPITGANAKISGTEFHRACNVAYDFAFSDDGNISVTKTAVSNTAAATQAGISCSAITSPIGTVKVVPKILF